ncbi:MAG: DUF3667 domain-containing protein [Chitinophagaceae bacterium]|nr:DUF3667 domain-containing protein [Chitinophagaceae bacterium]
MSSICKNCGTELNSKFCPDCGQAADTHEINLHFFWHDIQHGIFHYDKGIPFTVKELFTRPGHAIRDFIEGKRVKYFKPVALIVILAGIYMVLFHWLHLDSKMASLVPLDQQEQKSALKIIDWYTNHYALVTLLIVPFSALATYLAFRKAGYNYLQIVVLLLYTTAARLIISIVCLPITLLLSKNNLYSMSSLLGMLSIGYSIWTYLQFFNKISLESRVLRLFFVVLWYVAFLASAFLLTSLISLV